MDSQNLAKTADAIVDNLNELSKLTESLYQHGKIIGDLEHWVREQLHSYICHQTACTHQKFYDQLEGTIKFANHILREIEQLKNKAPGS